MAHIDLKNPRYYLNRHESWLAFNRRVLEEAVDESNPLLERVKFLAITASNLDEFVEVRVAALLQQLEQGNPIAGPDGLSPEQQIERVAHQLKDNIKSRLLRADGSYACALPNAGAQPSRNGLGFNVQDFFIELAQAKQTPLPDFIALAAGAA